MGEDFVHLEYERLADIVTGALTAREAALARAHLAACPACRLQFVRLEKLVAVMRGDQSEDAPTRSIANSFRAFDEYLAARRPPHETDAPPSAVERIRAALRLDSYALSPAFGVRSLSPSAERQLLYRAGEIDFDLRVAPAENDRWLVSGQLFNFPSGGDLELTNAAGESFRTAVNQKFQFNFPPVPAGVYQLKFQSATIEVEIPEIKLGF